MPVGSPVGRALSQPPVISLSPKECWVALPSTAQSERLTSFLGPRLGLKVSFAGQYRGNGLQLYAQSAPLTAPARLWGALAQWPWPLLAAEHHRPHLLLAHTVEPSGTCGE